MSPAGTATAAVLGVLAWVGLAVLVAIAIGRSIREADRREAAQRRSCCPHDTAPATAVRGEFRAVVVPIDFRSDPSSPGPERTQRRRPVVVGEGEAPSTPVVVSTSPVRGGLR